MFATVQAIVLNKMDILPYIDFSVARFHGRRARCQPEGPCLSGLVQDEGGAVRLDRLAEKDRVLKHVTVQGVVQGVGFRPFIYRLAREHGLSGWVANTSSAVEIEVEGREADVEAFIARIASNAPPRARIETVRASGSAAPAGLRGFRDTREPHGRGLSAHIARYRHLSRLPGRIARPRRQAVPLSLHKLHQLRPPLHHHHRTSPTTGRTPPWRPFRCADMCRREYDDPLDRRFHAQPNACPVCGPKVWLTDAMRPESALRRR